MHHNKIIVSVCIIFLAMLFTNILHATPENNLYKKYIRQYPTDVQNILNKAELLYSREEVDLETRRVAKEITSILEDKNPILLTAMTGGIAYAGILLDKLHFPLELDYIHVTRYQGDVKAKKELQSLATPVIPLKDRYVLVIDDVLDGGITLSAITEYCKKMGASRVYTVVLAEKKKARDPGGLETADFKAFTVDDLFLVGSGLDYKYYLRNLAGIYAIQGSPA